MIEQIAVKKFYSIIVSMGKMAKMCVLRLTADKVNEVEPILMIQDFLDYLDLLHPDRSVRHNWRSVGVD